jgi:hypothetical protein
MPAITHKLHQKGDFRWQLLKKDACSPVQAVAARAAVPRARRRSKDNVQSRSRLNDLLGEGKIGGLINGGQSIFLDNVPILNPDGTSNFNGVTWWFRDGTQNQAVIEGFDAVETPHDVGVKSSCLPLVPFRSTTMTLTRCVSL